MPLLFIIPNHNIMRKKIGNYSFLLILAGLVSCLPPYPSSDELYNDEFVIVRRDTTADFSAYSTYAIPDSLYYLNDDSVWVPYDQQNAEQVLAAIKDNMDARGYIQVARDADPDIAILTTVFNSTTILYYPGSWWGYWDCYYWYYYCGGWYYPSYPVISTYTSGSMLLEFADLKNGGTEEEEAIPLIFSSLIYTLTDDNPQFNVNKAVEGVNTAFEIAPYLSAN